jgi:hypothetical protein
MTEIPDLITQIIKLRENFHKYRAQYINSHNTLDRNKDARITIFSRCNVILDSTLLFIMFRTFQLKKDEWWSSLPEEFRNLHIPSSNIILSPPLADRVEIIKAVDNFWLFSYLILLFSSLESSVRTIVRVVYPNQFNDGRGDIMKIYQALLSTNFSCYKDLLELFRLSRNTSHNNGVYFPETKRDTQVTYRDNTYYFKDGKIVDFGDLAEIMFFEVTPDLLNMINDIVNSADVLKHPQIIDPSVNLLPSYL